MSSSVATIQGKREVDLFRRNGLTLAAATVGVLFAYAPLLTVHARNLWRQSEYKFAPCLLAVILALLWVRFREGSETFPPRRDKKLTSELICAVVAWLLLAGGAVLSSPLLAAISAIMSFAGVLLYLARFRHVQNLWGIWCLTWLLVPLPFGYGQDVVRWLQLLSSRVSSELLDLVGINHLLEGNILRLASRDLFVDEACSGIVSIMAMIAYSAALAVWKNRPLVHALLLVTCGVAWASVTNVARIFAIAFAAEQWAVDWSTGWTHELLGFGGFAVMFVVVVSTDSILSFLLEPIETSSLQVHDSMTSVPWVTVWNRSVEWGRPKRALAAGNVKRCVANARFGRPAGGKAVAAFGCAFAILGIYQLNSPVLVNTSHPAVARALTIQEGLLPDEFGTWVREDFQAKRRTPTSIYGHFSRSYRYRHQTSGLQLTISIDFPFTRPWHELCDCYEGGGWQVTSRTVSSINQGDANSPASAWRTVEADFAKRWGQQGFLIYCFFDQEGQAVEPPVSDGLWGELSQRWGEKPRLRTLPIFQVQAFVESATSLTDQQKDEVRSALEEFRYLFRTHVSSTIQNDS